MIIKPSKKPRRKAGVIWMIDRPGFQPDLGGQEPFLLEQVMGNAMAFSAFLCVDFHLGMRFPVAHAASWNIGMRAMAVGTRDRRVLRHILLQLILHVSVTSSANSRFCFLAIGNLCGFVHGVATHTGC
jgi:hypothetical protein